MRVAPSSPTDVDQAPRGHRLRLALERERLDCRDRDCTSQETNGALTEQDLARGCGLLQARREVDRVTAGERLRTRAVARDHLARVDPDANAERRAVALFDLPAERAETVSQVSRRANRAQRIVLVHARDPEGCLHGIPDELLHDAAVSLEHLVRDHEELQHHPPHHLRVELLADSGRPADVCEHERHELALFGSSRHARERRCAESAHPESGGILLATMRASHERSQPTPVTQRPRSREAGDGRPQG